MPNTVVKTEVKAVIPAGGGCAVFLGKEEKVFIIYIDQMVGAAITTLNGRSGILASHLDFGDPRRGWDFRSPGRGGINFEEIVRALNQINYDGPLSVEWEDCGMDREFGAREAYEFVSRLDFSPSKVQFDAAFAD